MNNEKELLFQQLQLKSAVTEHLLRGFAFCLLADPRNYIAIYPDKRETVKYVEGLPEDPMVHEVLIDYVLSLLNEYDQFRSMALTL